MLRHQVPLSISLMHVVTQTNSNCRMFQRERSPEVLGEIRKMTLHPEKIPNQRKYRKMGKALQVRHLENSSNPAREIPRGLAHRTQLMGHHRARHRNPDRKTTTLRDLENPHQCRKRKICRKGVILWTVNSITPFKGRKFPRQS